MAASTYLADDADINNAELYYTEWETNLQMQINRVERRTGPVMTSTAIISAPLNMTPMF